MKFKRQKPNASHWRNRRSQQPTQPVADTDEEIDARIRKATEAIRKAFEGMPDILHSQYQLALMCIIDGHRFDPYLDNGEICTTCGRSLADIKAGLGIALQTATKHTDQNGDGTYTHTFIVDEVLV